MAARKKAVDMDEPITMSKADIAALVASAVAEAKVEVKADAKPAKSRKEKERFFELAKVTTSGGNVMLAQSVGYVDKGKRPTTATKRTTKRIYADAIPEIVKTVTGCELTDEQREGYEKWNVPTEVQQSS